MAQFILKINLGNDAMRTKEDLAWALERASMLVRHDGGHNITDENGNTVGSWQVI